MNNYIIISFFTEKYKDVVKNLIDSIERFSLPSDIQKIQSLGDWFKNTQHKPKFVLSMLKKHKKDVVWIDADAVIQQYPILFDTIDCDIAVHYREGRQLLSGTVYFAYNDKVVSLVQKWIDGISKASAHQFDQTILANVIRASNLNVYNLPATYCQIFDSMKDAGDPVIEHFQASRELKTCVGKS